ncbi:MAG: hypothetical protein AAGA48_24040 [Myxococcota bacterium]
MTEFHQFPAVVELAVVPLPNADADDPIVLPRYGTPLADRARAAVARVSRSSHDVRDALSSVLEAVSGLERTLSWSTGTLVLSKAGIELKPELVLIGEGAIDLQRAGPWANEQPVITYVVLEIRDARHLLVLRGTVLQRDDGARLSLRGLRAEERDLIVAFVFQQEAKERRRALDHPD